MILVQVRRLDCCWGQTKICKRNPYPIEDYHCLFSIKTDVGFAILIGELPICIFGRDEILCSRPINIDQNLIKNVKSPVHKFDAVNKAYVYRIKYKSATGIIPNICFGRPYTLQISRCERFYN